MSGHAYTEDQLVEQPAIGLFAELGWQTVSAWEETFGATGTLRRETKGEVVLQLGNPDLNEDTRPAPELSEEERAEVKRVARELLSRLKQLLVLNWRQKASARSQVKLAIEDLLDTGLPRAYMPELYRQKCSAVFEHVYESYPERDAGVYAMAV